MSIIDEILDGIPLPKMARVRQLFDTHALSDIPAAVLAQLDAIAAQERIQPGMRVAITCGSRGVANTPQIMRTLADYVRGRGAHPVVIPAMGSHGGATAGGQLAVLAALGVTEESCGCPIHSSMETALLGHTAEGYPVQIDKFAAESDGIIVVNRIKPHPVFAARYESGLMKMLTIGLGKQKGAEYCHQMGFDQFHRLIPLFGNEILRRANILFGVGILENAYDQTSRIVALPPEQIPEREPELLLEAKANMPRLLPGTADVLVVDRMGKDISGDGMDPHITGRYAQYWTGTPNFTAKRLAVLDLTEESHGCFIGIEAADVTTQRVLDKADSLQTYPNSLTSCGNQHMPMHMKNDRQAIQCAVKICPGIDIHEAGVIRIRDTLHIAEILVSENLLDKIGKIPGLEVLSEPEPWPFREDGNLW